MRGELPRKREATKQSVGLSAKRLFGAEVLRIASSTRRGGFSRKDRKIRVIANPANGGESNLSKCQQNKIRARRGGFLRPAKGGNSERLYLLGLAHGTVNCFVLTDLIGASLQGLCLFGLHRFPAFGGVSLRRLKISKSDKIGVLSVSIF